MKMHLIALLLLFVPQDAEKWIRDLGDESIEVRDRASDALLKLGEPALAPLKKCLASQEDREFRSRIEVVVAKIETEIRRKAVKGGEEVCGLVATLRWEKELFKTGDSIKLSCEITNVAKEIRSYVPASQLDRTLPGSTSSSSSSHGMISVRQLSGERPTTITCRTGCGPGPTKSAVDLKSGESVNLEIALGEKLLEGEYEVTVTYFAKSKNLLPEAKEDLKSNTVRIKVER